jgi:hypothetical protein
MAECGKGYYALLIHVKLLITNNVFCIVQRATAQLKTEFFSGFGQAEAPLFFFLSFCSFFLLIWNFRLNLCTH